MTTQFSVSLEKEQLVFSAAHFITFDGNICERLHGHNYRVKCRVVGPLDENGYVVDFIALRDSLMKIVSGLDHHVLLPTQHETILVAKEADEVIARFEDRRWVFPAEDCVLLPIQNTTAELLAMHIAQELMGSADQKLAGHIDTIEVSVDENHGQWATCSMPWSSIM